MFLERSASQLWIEREEKARGGAEAKEGGAVERPACENRLSRRLHSGNHQTAVG